MTDLPRWDLSDLYDGLDCKKLATDKDVITRDIAGFKRNYYGKITAADNATLLSALRDYEKLDDDLGKIGSYSGLLFATYSTDSTIAAACQDLNDFLNDAYSDLLFFELEINHMDDALLGTLYNASEALRHYQPWLRDVRSFKPYQLEEKQEQLLLDKSTAANEAWIRLYEDISNRMKITIGTETLGLTQALDRLSHKDAHKRKETALALSAAFEQHAEHYALIYNTIIKDKSVNDKWRGFATPVSSRNVANLVEDEVVATLARSVTENFQSLSEHYYKLKASLLGMEKLNYWDRNAPYPTDEDSSISWDEAKDIVLNAYREFSPKMAELANEFFDKGWIDAPVYEGKTSGAFSHPTVPSVHPYILVNFQGKIRDVMTLAHELGHGVHQMLSASQGALMADTPLTLAETASVFGEQLTFQYLLNREQDEHKRTLLIASKVEDMLNTVTRQIAFYNFETAIHDSRKKGELSVDAISDIWMQTQRQSFGDAVELDTSYRFYWTYVSHFFHTPFYVYAYAFGDCLVNSLYTVYEEEKAQDRAANFEKKYMALLKAGGTLRHKELLAPFNLDITTSDFWQKGLHHISGMIDMLER